MVSGAADSTPDKLASSADADVRQVQDSARLDADPAAEPSPAVLRWRQEVMQLTKGRLTMLVLITTLLGFIYGSEGTVNLLLLFHTLVGTGLVAAGAAVLNQVMEVEQDRLMNRTKTRPLPAGRIRVGHALAFGLAVSIIGLVYLWLTAGWLPTALAAATIATYLLLYTPLKQTTVHNTLIGAVSGAIPPVIGSAAASGRVDAVGLFLFGILFFWQMPHFLAIAWMYRDQYERAGFRMWPMIDELGSSTSFQMFLHAICLLATSLVPVFLGWNNWFYGVIAMLAGLVLVALALVFWRTKQNADARKLFFSTLLYLPVQLLALVFTRI